MKSCINFISRKIKSFLILFKKILFINKKEIHYINGPETLPPPLSHEEESEIMKQISEGAPPKVREPLITHNLRLVVYIAKKFDSS